MIAVQHAAGDRATKSTCARTHTVTWPAAASRCAGVKLVSAATSWRTCARRSSTTDSGISSMKAATAASSCLHAQKRCATRRSTWPARARVHVGATIERQLGKATADGNATNLSKQAKGARFSWDWVRHQRLLCVHADHVRLTWSMIVQPASRPHQHRRPPVRLHLQDG